MSKGPVSVFVEHEEGKIKKTSLEMLGKAKKIAEQMKVDTAALVCGEALEKIAQDLAQTGIDRVYAFEHEDLALYQPLVYARLLSEWCKMEQPEVMWFSCSSVGVDLAARVAAKLETGLTAHCVGIDLAEIQGKKVIVHSLPGWGGNFLVKIICPQKRPQMATIRPGICEPVAINSRASAIVERIKVDIRTGELRIKALDEVKSEKGTGGLELADIVVSGGWGLRSAGSLETLYQLAKVLKAEVKLVNCCTEKNREQIKKYPLHLGMPNIPGPTVFKARLPQYGKLDKHRTDHPGQGPPGQIFNPETAQHNYSNDNRQADEPRGKSRYGEMLFGIEDPCHQHPRPHKNNGGKHDHS
jgi:electron transfer flavoprotein alpha subunit